MGSVKDLVVLASPKEDEPGRGKFIFSDRYSVFDWGEMPDLIPYKGQSLCLLGAYFFEKLERMGIETHYLGVEEEGEIKRIGELQSPTATMVVRLFRVVFPPELNGKYDYGIYQDVRGNFLVPFEFIYRHVLTESSSFVRRLRKGEINLSEYGLNAVPELGKPLTSPLFDVSTKLEEQDRYLGWKELLTLGIVDEKEVENIQETLHTVGNFIAKEAARIGLQNEDGKIEVALNRERKVVLVDVVGTPDESRFTYNGIEVSKEIARRFYRQTEWYQEIQEAKAKQPVGWKRLVKSTPPPLPPTLLQLTSWMYQRITMDITKREWFPGVPSLEEIVDKITRLV